MVNTSNGRETGKVFHLGQVQTLGGVMGKLNQFKMTAPYQVSQDGEGCRRVGGLPDDGGKYNP